MPKKLGVYLCTGCSIADAVDTAELAKVATRELKVPVCRTHPFLCGTEGRSLIQQDLTAGAVDTVVIGACSPRVKIDAFDFNHGSIVARVNLREHVAWSHKPKDEDTGMLAADYLRMGVTRALKTAPLEPASGDISSTVLVVGGGVTGVTAALETAEAGYDVVLVEKEPVLGGSAATLKKQFPAVPPYTEAQVDGVPELVQTASYHPRIRVFHSAQIVKTEGQPGMFDVTIRTESGEQTVRALTDRAGVSQPAVSKHLGVLKNAGLVRDRRDGRQTHYSSQPQGLAPLPGQALRTKSLLARASR